MTYRFAYHCVVAAGLMAITTASRAADQTLLSEAATAISEARSGQFDSTVEASQRGVGKITRRTIWAPGVSRTETLVGEKVTAFEVHSKGKPGLAIDRKSRTYTRTKAATEYTPSLSQLTAMKSVPPDKVEDLGANRFGDVDAHGFKTSLRNLGPDTGTDGTLSVWIDERSRLPLLVVQEEQLQTFRMERFQWNIPLSSDLFDVVPPDDYEDKTPVPPNDKEFAQILGALRTYSAAFGHYQQVEKILGDVTWTELRKKLGIPAGRFNQAVVEHKDFPGWLDASWGWGWINVVQNQNSDFRYFGKTVGPRDAGKVLMHWIIDSESYRVIYGDLKTEIVPANRLPALLETKRQ
ncbi:MAG: hypothetical protein O2856_15920 [Planctomycetota bacterium]|nr:hypothetical protein [Planctomycetota bacterium]